MTLNNIVAEYYKIKVDTPSYRLGQHLSNTLNCSLCADGIDLWDLEDEKEVLELFSWLCSRYHWDVEDLPIRK